MVFVGFWSGQNIHFLFHPSRAPFPIHILLELEINIAQEYHVVEGIGDLFS